MKKLAIAIALVWLFATPAWADLANGSFENGTNAPVSGFRTLVAGNGELEAWTVGDHSVDWIGSYWAPYEGDRSVDLSGNAPGSLSQAIDTAPGTPYRVSFWMAGNPDGGDLIKDLIVTAQGIASDTFSFDTTGKTRGSMGWVMKEFFFTATDVSTTLIFASGETDAYGPALDNVRVDAVPIPAAFWLLGTGLVGLAVLRRKRNG